MVCACNGTLISSSLTSPSAFAEIPMSPLAGDLPGLKPPFGFPSFSDFGELFGLSSHSWFSSVIKNIQYKRKIFCLDELKSNHERKLT